MRYFLKLNAILPAAVMGGLSLLAPSAAQAAPYTDHFTALIAGMESRSAALSNNTSKVAHKQQLALTKSLALLNTRSTSETTDLKNAVTITKSLFVAFPSDFANPQPTGTTFQALLENVFIGFDSDLSNLVHSAQLAINLLPASTCRTKAQAALNQAVAALPPLTVTDFTAYSTALGNALKSVIKGQAFAISKACTAPAGGGGGGTDSLTMTINGSTWSAAKGSAGSQYTQNTGELIIGGQRNNNDSALAFVVSGVTGLGTYTANVSGNYTTYSPSALYFVNSGQLTITTFNLASHKIGGTFSFVATAGANQVTATQGTFNFIDVTVH